MKDSSPSPQVDVIVERQWHIGIHARALREAGMLGTVYGGFPAYRYLSQGVPKESLSTQAWAIYWHEICRRLPGLSFFDVDVPRAIANWTLQQPRLNRYVACYSTVYKYLFPTLKDRGHILILERGSTHPENYFHQIQRGLKEAGLPYLEKLPAEYEEEIKVGRLSHFVVAGSSAIKESYVSRGYDPEKILLIPYGTDHNLFAYVERPTVLNRPLRMACVGSIGIRKGLQRLLWIGEWAQEQKIDLEIRLIGPLEPECAILLKKSTAVVHCLGVKKGAELVQVLQDCDLYCLPSYEEGFGISVIEGMSTGMPAIVSSEAGAREAVADGVDGIILTTFQPDEMAKKLSVLLNDGKKRVEMGRAARKKVEANYKIENYCQTLRTEYQRMFALVDRMGNSLSTAVKSS